MITTPIWLAGVLTSVFSVVAVASWLTAVFSTTTVGDGAGDVAVALSITALGCGSDGLVGVAGEHAPRISANPSKIKVTDLIFMFLLDK